MNEVNMDEINKQIDEWIEKTEKLTGTEVRERETWNYDVTSDTIRHYCYGTDDDNPLYMDPDYAAKTKYGKLIAHAVSKQGKFFEKVNKQGRRLNFVISDISYLDEKDELVGKATGTMIMATQVGRQTMFEKEIHKVSDEDLKELEKTFRAEKRTGAETIYFEDVETGQAIPSMVRGPLTIGDMVAWNAGIGPSYKAGRWGFLEVLKAPHAQAVNPALNFPVKYSQQHEDFNLAAGRGMPAPFDNGVMRFAWVAPMVTNWMGDNGFLRKLDTQVRAPGLYGDITTYEGSVTEKDEDNGIVTIDITGTNQSGQVSTKATALVELPRK